LAITSANTSLRAESSVDQLAVYAISFVLRVTGLAFSNRAASRPLSTGIATSSTATSGRA
jgi:hypothetical protein